MTKNTANPLAFSVAAKPLADALKVVASAISPKDTIPVLTYLELQVKGDQLSLFTTNLETSISHSIEIRGSGDGACAAPAKMISSFIAGRNPTDIVKFTILESGQAQIAAGRARIKIPLYDDTHAKDQRILPRIDFNDPSHTFTLLCSDLAYLLGKTEFAISRDESRYYLNGVNLADDNGLLRAAATDGTCLAKVTLELPAGAKELPSTIVPRITVQQALKLADGDREVCITIGERHVSFKFGVTTLSSKLVDGTFPDISRVIPQPNSPVKVNTAEMLRLAKGISNLEASAMARAGVSVRLSFSNGTLTVETAATTPELKIGKERLVDLKDALETDSDIEAQVGVNIRYVANILSQISSENATIFVDEHSQGPLRIQPDGEGEQSETYVLMPMRIPTI